MCIKMCIKSVSNLYQMCIKYVSNVYQMCIKYESKIELKFVANVTVMHL